MTRGLCLSYQYRSIQKFLGNLITHSYDTIHESDDAIFQTEVRCSSVLNPFLQIYF